MQCCRTWRPVPTWGTHSCCLHLAPNVLALQRLSVELSSELLSWSPVWFEQPSCSDIDKPSLKVLGEKEMSVCRRSEFHQEFDYEHPRDGTVCKGRQASPPRGRSPNSPQPQCRGLSETNKINNKTRELKTKTKEQTNTQAEAEAKSDEDTAMLSGGESVIRLEHPSRKCQISHKSHSQKIIEIKSTCHKNEQPHAGTPVTAMIRA